MTTTQPAVPITTLAVRAHVARCRRALDGLERDLDRVVTWAHELHRGLCAGHKLLVAGNGGSAALAQHLTAELVGRYCDDRRPYAAVPLCGDIAAVTAIGNDYGFEQAFARQVEALALPGDFVLLLSTSGRSPNLLNAARAAQALGATTWAMTGPAPNPLAAIVDDCIACDGDETATVQEVQQVAVHAVCLVIDACELIGR